MSFLKRFRDMRDGAESGVDPVATNSVKELVRAVTEGREVRNPVQLLGPSHRCGHADPVEPSDTSRSSQSE